MSQTIAGHPDTFSFAATYYLNDALESQTYPSGRTVELRPSTTRAASQRRLGRDHRPTPT